MVRAANGQKMSKSLGNAAIDPLDIIAKYGNDALRMAMIIGNTPGNDLKLDENDIRGYGKFGNKIWNASRFVLENISDLDLSEPVDRASLTHEDATSLDELNTLLDTVTKEMDEFKFSLAGEKLYHYFWHTFADVIIERCKKTITESEDAAARISAKRTLFIQLEALMRALHPFMPFITEKIWGLMPHLKSDATENKKLLIIESWPKSH
jgi:valyl-tRNA synthetase